MVARVGYRSGAQGRRPALLTVSGTVPADLDEAVSSGDRPRADYAAIAARADADIVDVQRARGELGRVGAVLHRVGPGALLGWYAFRHRRSYRTIFTDGEQVGIPLALLTKLRRRREFRHVMIAHVLSTPRKTRLVRWTRIASEIDRYIVYCSYQARYVRDRLAVPADRVVHVPFMVDTEFFDPADVRVQRRRMICSAGLERRDYATLIEAVRDLDLEVVITASSLWSKRRSSTADRELPPNVRVGRLTMRELRDTYAAAAVIVVPLVEVDFQAGITAILEGMSMARAVICSRVAGQTDTIVDGVTGLYVPPGDVDAMRQAIDRLLSDPDEADRLGRNARDWVVEHADIDVYADVISRILSEAAGT